MICWWRETMLVRHSFLSGLDSSATPGSQASHKGERKWAGVRCKSEHYSFEVFERVRQNIRVRLKPHPMYYCGVDCNTSTLF